MIPRLGIVSTILLPQVDGLADHSSGLASAFSSWAEVTLHTARGYWPQPMAGVSIVQSYDLLPRKAVADLESAIDRQPVDCLVVQYNPYLFGSKGFNPFLAPVFRRLKLKHDRMRLVLMVHERSSPANSPVNRILRTVQNRQFDAMAALADLTLFSTGPWFEAYRDKYSRRKSGHMPVGSNLPLIPADRAAVRDELKIAPQTLVLGTFGGNHPSRLWNYLAAAGQKLKANGRDILILSIGSAGPAIRSAIVDLPLLDLGKLPAEDVSKHLRAIDIHCAPFSDGVSGGRGTFFAGLQHGLPTVTTRGVSTDQILLDQSLSAFIAGGGDNELEFVGGVAHLADHPDAREKVGRQAVVCFDEHYSAAVLAERWRGWIENVLQA